MKLFLEDGQKNKNDNDELDSLFDDSDDDEENANEQIDAMANEFVFIDDLKKILKKNKDFVLNVVK